MRYFIVVLMAASFVWLSGSGIFAQTKGEGWQLYYVDESENRWYYYDKGSIQSPQKNIVKVWQKITEKDRSQEEYDKLKMYLQLDCRNNTYETLSYIEYDIAKGTVLNSTEYKENRPKQDVRRDALMKALLENVCP